MWTPCSRSCYASLGRWGAAHSPCHRIADGLPKTTRPFRELPVSNPIPQPWDRCITIPGSPGVCSSPQQLAPAGLLEGSHLREVQGLKPRRNWAPRMTTTTTQGCRPHTGVSSRLWAPKAELQLGTRPHKAALGPMTYGGFRLPMTELGPECPCSPPQSDMTCGTPNAQGDGIRRRGLWEVLRS